MVTPAIPQEPSPDDQSADRIGSEDYHAEPYPMMPYDHPQYPASTAESEVAVDRQAYGQGLSPVQNMISKIKEDAQQISRPIPTFSAAEERAERESLQGEEKWEKNVERGLDVADAVIPVVGGLAGKAYKAMKATAEAAGMKSASAKIEESKEREVEKLGDYVSETIPDMQMSMGKLAQNSYMISEIVGEQQEQTVHMQTVMNRVMWSNTMANGGHIENYPIPERVHDIEQKNLALEQDAADYVKVQEQRHANMSAEQSVQNTAIDAQTQKNAEQDERLDTLDASVSQQGEQLTSLSTVSASQSEQADALKERVGTLEESNANKDAIIESQNEKIARLEQSQLEMAQNMLHIQEQLREMMGREHLESPRPETQAEVEPAQIPEADKRNLVPTQPEVSQDKEGE